MTGSKLWPTPPSPADAPLHHVDQGSRGCQPDFSKSYFWLVDASYLYFVTCILVLTPTQQARIF